ncbi:hypothetical protein R1sor_000311 [Riccia sorocarpa]|uniref:DUF7869 domain-containing protein n=1 Tax=Riccia sorocarpa TaxID=122646 RepID=A0ABD3GV84_9MARC
MTLPVKIAGILNRDSGPPSCAHVCIGGSWKSDPNFTISSMAKYLGDCETFDGDMRGDLGFSTGLEHPLFRSLHNQSIFEKTFLQWKKQGAEEFFSPRESFSEEKPFTKLPHTFYIQLDNSGKDNKNWAVMAFLSELVARGVFKIVIVSFLIVGHTYEDVDAFFSKINRAMSGKHVSSIPQLLAEVYSAEEKRSIPRFVTEVADYKSHAEPYHQTFKGIRWPVVFKFSMLDNRPIYQYQLTYGDPWLPTFGNTIWKRKDPKSSIDFSVIPPPYREPVDVGMLEKHANAEEISSYLKAYVKHIESIQVKTNPTSDLCSMDEAIKVYWNNILKLLEESWPSNKDDFVPKNVVWLGKTTSVVNRDSEATFHNHVKVEWYRPKHKLHTIDDLNRYRNCMWKTQEWKKDPNQFSEEESWMDANACVHSWKSQAKSAIIKISERF